MHSLQQKKWAILSPLRKTLEVDLVKAAKPTCFVLIRKMKQPSQYQSLASTWCVLMKSVSREPSPILVYLSKP